MKIRHALISLGVASTLAAAPAFAQTAVIVDSTLPPNTQSWNAPSALVVSPDGRHVFVGNRGHESIAVFAVRPGGLDLVGHQQLGVPVTTLPWDLALDPAGGLLFAVNQLAGTLMTLRVDGASLETAGEPVAVPHPACILLV